MRYHRFCRRPRHPGGLAFALAAQDTIANVFGGIVI